MKEFWKPEAPKNTKSNNHLPYHNDSNRIYFWPQEYNIRLNAIYQSVFLKDL